MADYEELQSSINELERMVDSRRQGFVMILHDFRPVWDKAREIQAGFNGGVRFPTPQTRQAAWERFNAQRDEASRVFDEQKEQIRDRSRKRRDDILSEADSAMYDPMTDVMFFFDRTTVEEMKVKAGQLKEAFARLSGYKHEMLGEHKQECHERLQEVRESHDLWWSRYKEAQGQRHTGRQEARESKKERIQTNLDKNRERLLDTEERLERIRANVEENRDKLAETSSEKWIDLYTEWIEDGEADVEKTEEWINTLHEWVRQGEEQLDEIGY